ncbi:hypothetical protein BJV93_003750 [Clostridium butyricum]|nr:hypothetical protein [Clostridium butyricum]
MERLSWDAYNESESLIPIVENYKEEWCISRENSS